MEAPRQNQATPLKPQQPPPGNGFGGKATLSEPVMYYSTNDKNGPRVNFQTALMNGMAPDGGLYMMARESIPRLDQGLIADMRRMNYAEIATVVLTPLLMHEIAPATVEQLMKKAYDPEVITAALHRITGGTHVLWLTGGPTYSFKDYAARFYGVIFNYFLDLCNGRKVVLIATSGDTAPAVSHALHGLGNVDVIIFYPKGSSSGGISDGQRRQMTTLKGNIHAFEVNGDFSLCQELVKYLLKNREFAADTFGDAERFSSANSISVGRLLPQAVYPFFAFSRMDADAFDASIPSGNFGDMMGTLIAREMGLPVETIICALNENRVFQDFLFAERYRVGKTVDTPSSAMDVRHPSNLIRLVDFFGGHMYDQTGQAGKVIREGVVDRKPDFDLMRSMIHATSISTEETYEAMRSVYKEHNIMLDPHGAVGYAALLKYNCGSHHFPAVFYETAHPGKFPVHVLKAIGMTPPLPEGMQRQAGMEERIYSIAEAPDVTDKGLRLSDRQIDEARRKIAALPIAK